MCCFMSDASCFYDSYSPLSEKKYERCHWGYTFSKGKLLYILGSNMYILGGYMYIGANKYI